MLSLINSTVNIIGWSPLISFMAKWWYCVHYASIHVYIYIHALRMAWLDLLILQIHTYTVYSDMWCECAMCVCVYRKFKVWVWILLNNSSRLEFRVAMNRSQRYVPTLLQCAVCSHSFFFVCLSAIIQCSESKQRDFNAEMSAHCSIIIMPIHRYIWT